MKKFIFFNFLAGAVTMVTMAQSSHSNENVFILLPRWPIFIWKFLKLNPPLIMVVTAEKLWKTILFHFILTIK